MDSIRWVSTIIFWLGSRITPIGSRPCWTRFITHHDFSQHDDATIRRGQAFAGAIGDGPLGFPRHVILGLNRIHAEFRIGMKRIGRVLVGFNILHGRIVILYD